MKFGFVAKHRGAWPVNLMCEALGVSRSGFYAWLVRPRSRRSRDDEVLGAQVRQSFVGSDRTYGARRVWHDVLALGQRCGLHRIERLMREQALRARPRRRGLPQDLGERSAIADNMLDRQFDGECAQPEMGGRLHLHLDGRRLAVCGRGAGPVLAAHRRLVDAGQHDLAAGGRCADDGRLAPRQAGRAAASLGPGQPVHQRALPGACSRSKASPAA